MHRHPANDRVQHTVISDYKARVLEMGIIQGVRGNAWAIESAADGEMTCRPITHMLNTIRSNFTQLTKRNMYYPIMRVTRAVFLVDSS